MVAALLKGQDFIPLVDQGEEGYATRFAPSPTGHLHIGHAYAALFAFEAAQRSGGSFHLRIEDIDVQRCRQDFEASICQDLRWLGLLWKEPALRQSDRFDVYREALRQLQQIGVVYPCFCSRKQIRIEVEEAGRAPHGVHTELVYPGTCRHLDPEVGAHRIERGEPFAWRLDVARSLTLTGPLYWYDIRAGWIEAEPHRLGDVVLARKDTPTSYHLAVVVDDAAQGISLVTRGEDLFQATHVHRLIQALLGLPTPHYYHHNLVADSTGQRLAKRNRAVTLRHLRDSRRTPDDIWRMIGLTARADVLLA
jgi:glutamyl-Q tRNA(Asp) synthetase